MKSTSFMGLEKFSIEDKEFHENIKEISNLGLSNTEFIHHFSIYTGHVNLARYLFFYDLYKQISHLNGHIADVGTWNGASLFFMAKLIRLFECHAYTQVHGFDWFKGMKPDKDKDDSNQFGLYTADYDQLINLIKLQRLEDVAVIHKMDITRELEAFFYKHQYLRFKMVFIDCGIANVLEKALACFWPKLVKGGVLVMDHYNCEASPSESSIVEKYIGNNYIRSIPQVRQPTGYIIKEK